LDGKAVEIPSSNFLGGGYDSGDALTNVTCELPLMAPYLKAELTLLEDDAELSSLQPLVLASGHRLLSFFQGWDSFSFNGTSGNPAHTHVLVSGYAFQDVHQYFCRFLDAVTGVVAFEVPALVNNSTLLQCGKISRVNVSLGLILTVWMQDDALNMMVRVPFTNNSLQIKQETSGCRNVEGDGGQSILTCLLIVTPTPPPPPLPVPVLRIWETLEPSMAFAGVAQKVTVKGKGFESNVLYFCKFENDSAQGLVNWSGGCKTSCNDTCQSMCLSDIKDLTKLEQVLPLHTKCLFDCFNECVVDCKNWWNNTWMYTWNDHPARFQDEDNIMCDIPTWCQDADEVQVSVWQKRPSDADCGEPCDEICAKTCVFAANMSGCLSQCKMTFARTIFPHFLGPLNYSRLLRFTTGWNSMGLQNDRRGAAEIQDAASGGVRLGIRGYGFRLQEAYSCVFSRVAGDILQQMESEATVLTPKSIECLVPDWGATFAAGPVDILLLVSSNQTRREFVPFYANRSHVGCEPTCMQICAHLSLLGPKCFASDSECKLESSVQEEQDLKDVELLLKEVENTTVTTLMEVRSRELVISNLYAQIKLQQSKVNQAKLRADLGKCSTRFQFNPEVKTFSATVLSAAGGDSILLRGTGFDVGEDFYVVFNYRNNIDTHTETIKSCTILNSTLIKCETSVWNFTAVENASVSFMYGTHGPLLLQPPPNISIRFKHVVSKISNTVGLWSGGTEMLVEGWGFRTSNDEYWCIFGQETNNTLKSPAAFLTFTKLICLSPERPETAEMVAVTLYSQQSNEFYDLGYFQYLSSVQTALPAVADRIGGTPLEINGGGFDSLLRYLCQFSLQVPGKRVWNGPSSELDGANLDQNAALVRVALLPLREKNCKCPGACRTFAHGSFSDGSEGADYGPDLDCYWVLAPVNASSIMIHFQEFAVESPWDHVSIYTCDPEDVMVACAKPVLFKVLTGHGLPNSTFLVVPSARVLVFFETDHLLAAQGFTANFEPYSKSTEATVVSSTVLTCPAPSWDPSMPSLLFGARLTEIHVHQLGLTKSDKNLMLPGSSMHLVLAHINRAPWFTAGNDVHLPSDTKEKNYSFASWAGDIMSSTSPAFSEKNYWISNAYYKTPIPEEQGANSRKMIMI
jgi:hypothetical protein